MLVPATTSTGIRFSSSHLITPTCANPSAPPPSSTRPIRGRWLLADAATALGCGWATPPGVSCAQRLDASISITQTAKLQSFIAPLFHCASHPCGASKSGAKSSDAMLACKRNGARVFAKNCRYYCDTFPLVAKVFTIVFASLSPRSRSAIACLRSLLEAGMEPQMLN